MHAWAEVCHLSQSSNSPLSGFLRSIGWRITDQTRFLQTLPHTNCISNSAILHNDYISLLSDLCACVHAKKNGIAKEAIVLQWAVWTASWDLQKWKKAMGWCTAQWKMLLFYAKNIVRESHKFELEEEEEEERKTFWPSGDFLVQYFHNAF